MTRSSTAIKTAALVFSERAVAFCTLMEKHAHFPTPMFLRQCHWLLSELNVLALSLPEVRGTLKTDPDLPISGHDLYKQLQAKLGARDYFWVVFNPYSEEAPVQASLADGFRDIYLEMKEGLLIYNSGSPQACADAIWTWKFGHEHSWGKHVVEALMALHDLQGSGYV
jgi:hypothetical protein